MSVQLSYRSTRHWGGACFQASPRGKAASRCDVTSDACMRLECKGKGHLMQCPFMRQSRRKALRYGTCCQGISQLYLSPTRLSTNGLNHTCLCLLSRPTRQLHVVIASYVATRLFSCSYYHAGWMGIDRLAVDMDIHGYVILWPPRR